MLMTDKTPRDVFFAKQTTIERWEDELDALEASARRVLEADSLTDLGLHAFAESDNLHEAHVKGFGGVLEWYQNEHPRRRKIPFSRIVEEYGDDHPEVQAAVEPHNERMDEGTSAISRLKREQGQLIDDIDIREVDEPTVLETYDPGGYHGEMNDASYKEATCLAGFQAIWLDTHHIRADWVGKEDDRTVSIRTYHHPDDALILERLSFCKDGEAFLHHWFEHWATSKISLPGSAAPHRASGHTVHIDPGQFFTLYEEARQTDGYPSPGHPPVKMRRYHKSKEWWIDKFQEHRAYPAIGEVDADRWFLHSPDEVRANEG